MKKNDISGVLFQIKQYFPAALPIKRVKRRKLLTVSKEKGRESEPKSGANLILPWAIEFWIMFVLQ